MNDSLKSTLKGRAFLALVIAGLFAGCAGIIIKNIEMDAKSITWVRMVIPTVLFALWMWYKNIKFMRGNMKFMLIASLLNALRLYLYIFAFVYTSIGTAAILFYTWPIFATILGIYFLKESINRFHLMLVIVAFLGIVISYSDLNFSFDNDDLLGMLAALIASGLYAITVIIFKSEVHNYTRNEIIFYQNFFGSIIFLPFFIMSVPTITSMDLLLSSTYAILVGMGVFYLFFYGLKYLKAYVASAVMYLEVVGAVTLGYIFLDERLTLPMIIGGTFIIISSFLLNQRSSS